MNLNPDIYKQRTPCSDCPFRREDGVRHNLRMMLSYISYFCGFPGATFPCHKSVPADDSRDKWSAWREGQVLCAGGMIFALKQGVSNAVMLDGVQRGVWNPAMYDAADVACVFDSVEEMTAASVEEDA